MVSDETNHERKNKMSCYTHLSTMERESLLIYLKTGKNISQIAKALGRNRSTISRELKRNAEKKENYSAVKAQQQYKSRRIKSVRKQKLADPKCAAKVKELLDKWWSPEEICYRLKKENNAIQISTCTIYRGIEKGLIPPEYRKKLRIKGKVRHGGHKKSKCGHLDIEYTIHDRPKSVENRKRIGHWESDTVRGAMWSGCIASHAERASRYAVLAKLSNRSAKEYTEATVSAFSEIPGSKCLSFTPDHGKEFSMHRELSKKLNCKVYFADPSSPWQRGTNENTNGLIRQFFPKRTSFADVTQDDVLRVADILNHRPRKCLDWKSPFEVFFNKVLHLT